MQFNYLMTARELWKELNFMLQLENICNDILYQYETDLEPNSQN